jgi:hypothetical protein
MIAFEPGHILSQDDLLKIQNYYVSKWAVTGVSNDTTMNVTSMQPQPGTPTPPAKTSFTSVNAGTLATSGGSSAPLVLTQPPQTTNVTAMQLVSLPSGTNTFTALVNFSLPYANTINGGVVLRNSQSSNITTIGIFYQNSIAGSFRPYWYAPGTNNGTWAAENRQWYAAAGRNVWMRVVVNTTSAIFLSSVSGRVNEWNTIFTVPMTTTNPNQIGFYLNAIAPAGFLQDASLTVVHMDPIINSYSPQSQSSYYTTNFTVIPTPTPGPTTVPTYLLLFYIKNLPL